MKQYKCLIALFAAALFIGACSDDDNDYGTEGIAIETPAVTGETSTSSASLSVAVNMRDDVRYSGAGFCYSLQSSPTIHSATVKALISNGTLSATLTDLAPKRTYYARAFVCIYQGDVVYSPEFTFSTADGTLDEQLAAYQAPIYPDNYIAIADWNMRGQWNLANVHDPTVVLGEDGYYFEFNVTAGDWANCYYKWNAIDPSYIITPEGAHWLIYGSWHSGIVAMELNEVTGMPKQSLGIPWAEGNAPAEYGQLIATRQAGNRWQASEGPEIVYNPQTEYYYLFMAYDALETPYNTRVARSKSITGPYLGIDGANVTEGADMYPVVTHPYKFANSEGWVGISHCAIFDDGNGNWYYASQGRLPESVDNAVMLGHVRSIRWTKDGWPLVMPERYGAVPQAAITEEELIGDWEHIDLSYVFGQQKESSTMTLTDDHKVSEGTWKDSSWSFDAENQILTVNGVDLYLQRETDWEAKPRTHTIVYASYTDNKTYWGKKSK